MSFQEPGWFWLIPLLALGAAWRWWPRRHPGLGGRREAVLVHSLADAPECAPPTWRTWAKVWLGEILLLAALVLAVTALARPVRFSAEREFSTEGLDLLLCLDLSGSMQAQDFKPNRFEAARAVALDFIKERGRDRIGLVVFAGEAYTQCPLTLDHDMLGGLIGDLKLGEMEDGTAVGLALATAAGRLKESKAKSRVVILLTDGVNNRGLDPRTALDMAVTLGLRVYTIGVGQEGLAPIPVQTPFGVMIQQMEVDIDEDLLREMADRTGGRYFRARDLKELKEVYAAIDRLEKTEIKVKEYRLTEERWFPWLAAGLALLLLERLLRLWAGRLAA
ncbi:MAG: VWA domain-containing protein [bacterium]|jgi:Ca-activated chloride channel family protein|nr:VWA domain-containing protein [bacterium]